MSARPVDFWRQSVRFLAAAVWFLGCASSPSPLRTENITGAATQAGQDIQLVGDADQLRAVLTSSLPCLDTMEAEIRAHGGGLQLPPSPPLRSMTPTLTPVIQPRYLKLVPPVQGFEVSIGAYKFDPGAWLPIGPPKWCVDPPQEGGFYVVQLERVPGEKERSDSKLSLTRGGPGLGYLEKLDAADVVKLRGKVRAIEFLQPYMKIDPNLMQDPDGNIEGGVWVWHTSEVSARLAPFGVDPGSTFDDDIMVSRLAPPTTTEVIKQIAFDPGVLRLERAGVASLRSYVTSWTIQSGTIDVLPVFNHLKGSGQIIGLLDDYSDLKNCAFPGGGVGPNSKFISYDGGLGQKGSPSVHGTTVSGILAGAGDPAGDPAKASLTGQAPNAQIRFHWWKDLNTGNPTELIDIWRGQYNAAPGARIFSNSWGDNSTNTYTAWSYQADLFSWENEEVLVVFAVSNDDGPIKSPENAKNILAVGASQKPTGEGSVGSGGHGPTLDGRRKPEIFAPGCSMESATPGDCIGSSAGDCATSWATAAVAGAAALVREYFVEGFYPGGAMQKPSGALIKAMLLNAAVDMTGVTGYPSPKEGWGRLLLNRSLVFNGEGKRRVLVWDVQRSDADALKNQDARDYDFSLAAGDSDLRVTLVWTDPPASVVNNLDPRMVSATSLMVNNLDLIVKQLDGDKVVYYGNDINEATGQSKACVSGSCAKDVDNVEQVATLAPKDGKYRVTVKGARVSSAAKQGFALVISWTAK